MATTLNLGPHNASDVAFAIGLSQLGQQSESMASLVTARADHPELANMAAAVRQRSHDVDLVSTWLDAWHQPLASSAPGHPGALSPAELHSLAGMHGNDFDDAWLEHMAGNQTALIALCQQELARGTNPQARTLASGLLAALRAEQTTVQRWHSDWEHDSRMGTTQMTPSPPITTRPHTSDSPHPSDDTHMSDAPHVSDAPHTSASPHASASQHDPDDSHMSSSSHR